MHVPFWQVSVCVQALLSLQEAVLFVCTHPVVILHESFVQILLSLQLVCVPGLHEPPEQ